MIPNNLNEILEKHDQITNNLKVNNYVLGRKSDQECLYPGL